jgi:diguanylate cyclase (GGDEF)-like protein/PAS domain S-box-containing protein
MDLSRRTLVQDSHDQISLPETGGALRYGLLLPGLVLLFCLGLTYQLWRNAEQSALQELQTDFNYRKREALERIGQRMKSYEQVLRGVQGLFNSSVQVERSEFARYVASLHLEHGFAGIQSVGLALAVSPAQKEQHIAAVRKQGFPDYSIMPAGGRDLYSPALYVAPFSGPNLRLLGYDLFSEPVRHAAMLQARDSGSVAISGKLRLRSEAEASNQAGFQMFLPIYRIDADAGSTSQHARQIAGWAFASFRMVDLMQGLLGDHVTDIDFEIYDGQQILDTARMYDSDDAPGSRNAALFQSINQIEVAGRPWTVAIRSHENFERQLDKQHARMVALTGVIASLMLAFITWLLLNGRVRAQRVAQQMNRDLIDSEYRWHFALEGAGDGVWDWDLRSDSMFYSGCWKRMLGIAQEVPDQKIGKWQRRLHPDDRENVLAALQAYTEQKSSLFAVECRLLGDDGIWKWVLVRGTVVTRGAAGQPLRMIGTNSDISERKRADEELQLAAMVYRTSAEAMMVSDAANQIIAINPAFTRMTGYEASEAIGRDPNFLDSRRHDNAFFKQMWQEIQAEGHWQGEIWNRRKNGEEFAVLCSINTIRNQEGAIQRHVALLTDITEKKRSEELIWQQANFDTLTGLPNRRLFRNRLEHEVEKARRSGLLMAVLFIDLDLFKEVNDTLGHDYGDQLLVEAARRISACVRKSDTVARLGGDEFTVILVELHATNIELVAQKILARLAEPYQIGPEVLYLSASIGITLYPVDAGDPESLLKNADQAMYLAKKQGRNRFNYYTSAMQEGAQKKLRISTDLRTALATEQLQVHFQPIVDLASGRIVKAEALLRWCHPQHGMISPAEFIPVAEESGLINEIGDWVFKIAVKWTERWSQQLGQPFQISVNKSPAQFQAQAKYTNWADYLQERGLPGNCIAVEITEGLLLNAAAGVKEQLLQYRDAGIKVSIDDFGTGYSSMSYLKKFDIDYLKIDQSFVRDMVTDASDRAIAEAIIVMAHKLGYKVIAEGVETVEQQTILAQAECDYFQGWLFSKAVPPEQFEALLLAQKQRQPKA